MHWLRTHHYNACMWRWITDLNQRRRQPELMDDPALAAPSHHAALRGLERINRISRSSGRIWDPLAKLAAQSPGQTLKVLDIATGAGDVPIALWQRAKQAKVNIELAACDTSDRAIRFARERAASQNAAIEFMQLDALRDPLPEGYDVLTCSLFLHHLDEANVITLLASMARVARRMIIISDLERSRIGYALAVGITRLLTRSKVVHTDGPLSVAGAFTIAEAAAMANEAGLQGATVRRIFPWRWRMIWKRESLR